MTASAGPRVAPGTRARSSRSLIRVLAFPIDCLAIGQPVPRPITRGFAVGLGLLGVWLGAMGVLLGVAGDALVRPGHPLSIAAGLTVVAAAGALVARTRPLLAAMAFAASAAGSWLALGSLLGPWYDGLLAATALGPTAETQYWYDAPALPLLWMAGVALVIATVTALLGVDRARERVA